MYATREALRSDLFGQLGAKMMEERDATRNALHSDLVGELGAEFATKEQLESTGTEAARLVLLQNVSQRLKYYQLQEQHTRCNYIT